MFERLPKQAEALARSARRNSKLLREYSIPMPRDWPSIGEPFKVYSRCELPLDQFLTLAKNCIGLPFGFSFTYEKNAQI
jgi:hypothetical protein